MKQQNARLFVRQSQFEHPNNKLESFIQTHPFNARLQILQPGSRHQPLPTPDDIFSRLPTFYSCHISLPALISEQFLNKWIRDPRMEITGVSIGGYADNADVICIVQRVLRLTLTPDTYRSLGLIGRKHTQRPDRYVVDIKLDGQHFRSGHRLYERVMECFERCSRKLHLWLTVNTNGNETGLTDLEGEILKERLHCGVSRVHTGNVPHFPARSSVDDPFWSSPTKLQSIFNWLGAISLGIDNLSLDGCVAVPTFHEIHCLEWKGAIGCGEIVEALRHCHELLTSHSLPWTALVVCGFLDTPLSYTPHQMSADFVEWNNTDHAVLDDLSGENDYVILCFGNDEFIVFVAAGSGDTFRTL